LICTQPSGEKVKLHGEEFYINSTSRVLPQGAPTSPAITNIICKKMDARLLGIAKSLGLRYTRYADDLTFSGPASVRKDLNKLFWRVKGVVKSEGFALHPKKTKIMSNGNRKEVTGVVVNEKPAVSRKKLKAFRALLYQIEKDGPKGKRWGSGPDLMESILGYARFIYMVDPIKGKKYLDQVKAIRSKYKPKKAKPFFKPKAAPNPTGIPPKDKGEDSKPWWKIW
jgi:retron-type reverse transcriptase